MLKPNECRSRVGAQEQASGPSSGSTTPPPPTSATFPVEHQEMKFLANSSYFFSRFCSLLQRAESGVGLGVPGWLWFRGVENCRREADFPALDERPLKEFDGLSNTAKCFDIFHTLDNQLRGLGKRAEALALWRGVRR